MKPTPTRELVAIAKIEKALPPALAQLAGRLDSYEVAPPYIPERAFAQLCRDVNLGRIITRLLIVAYDMRYPTDLLRATHGLNLSDLRYFVRIPEIVDIIANLRRTQPDAFIDLDDDGWDREGTERG